MELSKTPAQPSSKRKKIIRIASLVAALAVIALIVVIALNAILPGFFDILEHGDQTEIEAYIRSFGSIRGVLLAFLLQFIQILSIFFPGGPIQIAIGLVFGTLEGFLICHLGYVLANLLVFYSARRLGNRIDQLFSGSNRTKKLKFISNAQHPGFVVALSCLMPLLPNGLVPYIAARTKITTLRFTISVYLGSIPTLLLLCAIGNKILQGDYLKVALLCGLLVAGVLILYFNRNRIFALGERIQTNWERARELRREKKQDK
ncbi:MAG TPA: VTT domain-containing protein [Eubacteriales bacterium]|nr:VTT domain-containing protein [Eubacteriales bacterium]